MKVLRCLYEQREKWGVLVGETVVLLQEPPFERVVVSSKHIPLEKVSLLAPSTAGKVVLVGLNYRDHAAEMDMDIPSEPVLFLKPPSAIIAHNQRILYPAGVGRLDYEGELAMVVKKEARNIPEKRARDYILGFTCLNDVTARDLQKKDGQWTRAKSFDTFCPVGPWLETDCDPKDLKVRSYLNGEIRQDSSTSNFIFPVAHLIAFISSVMTLFPGDIVSTGTPPGIGEMQAGDTIEIDIENVGKLSNKVIKP